MRPIELLVLVGSAVDRFHADLSYVYARGFLETVAVADGYRVTVANVSPDGLWRFGDSIDAATSAAAPALSVGEALNHIASSAVDVMVPQMFCRPGMTTYRSLFDLLGVPYVGNTPEVMAMAADKNVARAVVAAAGVAVPAGEVLRSVVDTSLELPVVVKPVDSDNSVGVALVREQSSFGEAVGDALRYSKGALVEEYIELGREVRCGVIVRDGELVCLPLEEYAVDEKSNPVRGRTDKLNRSAEGDLYLVAKDNTRAWIVPKDDPITESVWDAARRAHIALGCRHYSLFDFRIDPNGKPWFLEAGLYCSYSPGSVVAVMAAARGIATGDLFADSLNSVLSPERRSR